MVTPVQSQPSVNEVRLYVLEEELMKLTSYASTGRFLYEQEHFLGSYEIVPSIMKVKFSYEKYFNMKNR